MKPNVIVICGQTALGKTSIALELARIFSGEIIGADSMQIYRYMDIGTAKPTACEQATIPHHMINIVDPDESFSAMRYAKMTHKKIAKLYAQNITPFVVGGTGFYIKALVHGLFMSRPVDMDIRMRLKEEAAVNGAASLYKRLSKCDPDTAKRIHPNDTYRIIRSLEIYETTGKSISKYQSKHGFADGQLKVLKIGLHMNRDLLYNRIDRRVDAMIEAGLLDEVKGLLDMGYLENLKSMQSIGYRHMVDFITGRLSWDEALQTLKRDTRRYAKRQMTWFKADSEIVWKEPDQLSDICGLIRNFL